MTTASSASADAIRAKLDDRYGRSRGRAPRWAIALGLVAVGAAIGWFAWMTVAGSLESVDADTTGFEVIDDRVVNLRFQVTAPVGREVACVLEAQDEDHGIVGWRVLVIPPSTEHTRGFVETIPTTAGATTGLINSCWVT
ncbi:DUF4307 domain-containing protein [Microbacterium sp. bgisy207]|jgi:hypothetical protein|uniref:DUF4307 domain-containing protein n=1 Tax=Microbacterium sp. bgisy207 TaxID=3413800 RepID=UPI003EBCFA41